MTSLLGPIGERYSSFTKDADHNTQHSRRNILKSKENTYKHKCNKVLKRKLKKYKLRQDGKEDQDIIDVSDTLVSSLFIRSPNKAKDSLELEIEELRPKNYLFRMVKRKQITLKTTKDCKSSGKTTKSTDENEVLQISSNTEEKKQTNAFKLLMDSRNKSLGSNSPGKEKPTDEAETQEIIEKKNVKAKRNLMLQKMAEQKGSQKKKEVEEQHEKYIKKKMEKRAEKLKNMIMYKEPKTVKDDVEKKISTQKLRSPLDSIETEKNGKVIDKPKTLQLVSIFSESINKKVTAEKKLIPKEDEDFLKKLSPSLKKKESMLSYFKKVEKDIDSTPADSENDNVVIKVKVGLKQKKRGRKKKLSLNRGIVGSSCDVPEKEIELETEHEMDIDKKKNMIQPNVNTNETAYENSKQKRKRKREGKEGTNDDPLPKNDFNHTDDTRPRRTAKKPVKYNDDVVLSSSDEELHIFTPKKKKHIENKNSMVLKRTIDQDVILIDEEMPEAAKDISEKISNKVKKPAKDRNPSKPVKLAPIFGKPQPDQAAIDAKQKFLQSGVPEQLKKLMFKQKDNNTVSNSFPTVVHVQQLDSILPAPPDFNLDEEICMEKVIAADENDFSIILNLSTSLNSTSLPPKNSANAHIILQSLKEAYPRFPVYRTYKLLRGKKKGEFKCSNIFSNLDNSLEILNCSIDMQTDNPDQLTWSDKYKPLSGSEIIGNFESIKEIKKWLVTWTENDTKSKVCKLNDSDSSDYYQSDPDSRDSMKSNNNLLVLSGPVGSGKTSCVYAVAAELSMKVIEVNASSKRTGKIMLQDLQEATQSHKVNRGPGSAENSQNSQKVQEIAEPPPENKVKKRGRPKKTSEQPTPKKPIAKKEKTDVAYVPSASQESIRTAMSLILIDDADIVFDQDDGFCSAIMQLVQCSKRPVILITGSLSLPHLQRFQQSSKILKMQPLLPSMLGTWLDLVCLADSGTCWPGLGAKFLNFFKGDMRKTINCLQFFVGSQEQVLTIECNSQTNSQNNDVIKLIAEDEGSCSSWADRDIHDDKNMTLACDKAYIPLRDTFINERIHIKHMRYPLRMFNIWWSVPKIFNIESYLDSKKHLCKVEQADKNGRSLDSICSVLDTISDGDYLNHFRPETEANVTSHPWYGTECNSVSELENFDCYDGLHEINKEISYELVRSSITTARENMGLDTKFDVESPGMSAKRRRDRTVSRHINMTTYLSPSLDRKALALDYWSSCRAICRIEKSKTDSNSKRNNRFCHYLKSLSVLCKSDSFDILANSLNPSGN